MADFKDLDRKVIKLAKMTVNMCTKAGSGHPSSSLSLIHITTALMYRIMRYDPKNPWNSAADRLIFSEGHAVPVVYAAYCDLGGAVGTQAQPDTLSFDDAMSLREAGSVLDGHPNPAQGFPFFDAATGSLGMGVSVAAGLALAARLDNLDRRFYVVVGDGESREGQIWEAMDCLAENKLTAVRVIFNCNQWGQSEKVSVQQSPEALAAKAAAFGFEVKVIDGHNWDEVFAALAAVPTDKPIAIIAKTVKGWGVKTLYSANYHGKPLSEAQLPEAMADLDAKAAELGVAGGSDPSIVPFAPAAKARAAIARISAGPFSGALAAAGLQKELDAKKLSTRRAYGVALAALGAGDDRVVATDGDVKNSTFADMFAKKFPNRFFEARIAEQNMVSMAVGLAAGGKVPFASTFAKFVARAYDQIELAAITNANVKVTGSHAGISLAADGPSQMAVADMAFFRAFARARRVDGAPAVRVFLPSDAVSAFKLTEQMANCDGLCYMRTHRPDVPFIYEEGEEFPFGGFKHLVDGEDIAIVTSGYMLHVCRQAIQVLEDKSGLKATLIDAYSMPLATDEILQIGDDCRGSILVVEDNYLGGIADEISSAAAQSDYGVSVTPMYVRDIPKSAKTPEEILKMVHLSAEDIADMAQKIFDRSEG